MGSFTNIAYANVDSFVMKLNGMIVNPLILFFFALALVYFLYGMFEFILNQANDEKKTTGKSHMLWGIIGIVIMMGVWFILNVILNTLNISPSEINPEQGHVKLNEYNPTYPPKRTP